MQYLQTKKPEHTRERPKSLKRDTEHYPEAIFDNYITHLENNGFINKDGTTKETNDKGEEIPTIEQYAENNYHTTEIKEQAAYENNQNTTRHSQPPITSTNEHEEETRCA